MLKGNSGIASESRMNNTLWIKVRVDICEHPKVITIASRLRLSPEIVVGKLVKLWCWAKRFVTRDDGVTSGLTPGWVDTYTAQAGFFAALAEVDWIAKTDTGIAFPNFSDWNSKSLHAKEKDAERQRRYRDKKRNVTRDDAESSRGESRANHAPRDRDRVRESKIPLPTLSSPETADAAPDNRPTTPTSSEEDPTRKKKSRKQKSAEPPDTSEVLLTYPCDGDPDSWSLRENQRARWAGLYPKLDILAECRKALAWVEAHSDRRKTAKGMSRFLVGWLTRANDRGGSPPLEQLGGKPQPPQPRETLEERVARITAARKRQEDDA